MKAAGPSATVDDLFRLAFAEHWGVKCKPSTVLNIRLAWRKHIRGKLGNRIASTMTAGGVAAWHARVGATVPGAANRALAYMSKAFAVGQLHGVITINPCKPVRKFKGNKVERFLSDDEYRELFAAIGRARADGKNIVALSAISVLLGTGLRRGEVLSLSWSDVDQQNCELILRDSKTGGRRVSISSQMAQLLEAMPRTSSWVFPGPKGHLKSVRKVWLAVRSDAGMPHLRLHDLRHSFASLLARQGKSLLIIGQLLGHSSVLTTARYAHLAMPAKQAAANDAGAELDAILNVSQQVLPGERRDHIVQILGPHEEPEDVVVLDGNTGID